MPEVLVPVERRQDVATPSRQQERGAQDEKKARPLAIGEASASSAARQKEARPVEEREIGAWIARK